MKPQISQAFDRDKFNHFSKHCWWTIPIVPITFVKWRKDIYFITCTIARAYQFLKVTGPQAYTTINHIAFYPKENIMFMANWETCFTSQAAESFSNIPKFSWTMHLWIVYQVLKKIIITIVRFRAHTAKTYKTFEKHTNRFKQINSRCLYI